MKETNASHLRCCFGHLKMTLTNTYTIQHIFNNEYLRSRLGEAVVSSISLVKSETPQGDRLNQSRVPRHHFDNIKFATKFSHYYCDNFKFNQQVDRFPQSNSLVKTIVLSCEFFLSNLFKVNPKWLTIHLGNITVDFALLFQLYQHQ